jgi:hypothetical protein
VPGFVVFYEYLARRFFIPNNHELVDILLGMHWNIVDCTDYRELAELEGSDEKPGGGAEV